MNAWSKLPVLAQAGLRSCCPTCGRQSVTLEMGDPIVVGFGFAGVTRDEAVVWAATPDSDVGIDDDGDLMLLNCWTVQDAENAALSDPDHDWRVTYRGPLSEAVYQRHGAGRWMMVERGRGFA